MKLYNTISLSVIFLTILLSMPGCEEIEPDPCDDTAKPEIAVTIRTTVHIRDLNDQPVPNEPIHFEIYKKPCGAPSKGKFTYDGTTDEFGNWTCPLTGYNLRNSDDMVYVTAIANELENYFEQNYAAETFKYGEFSTLSTKEVHLYIYSKSQ